MASSNLTFRRVVKIGLVGVGIVLLLVVVALVLVTLPPGERVVRGIIENQLSGILDQPVEVGEFETNLFSRVRLQEVRVLGREPDSGGIYVGELVLEYRFWPILGRKLAIERVSLNHAEIVLIHDSTHGYNLPILDSLTAAPATAEPETGAGFTIDLGSIDVKGVEVRYIARNYNIDAHLPGIAVSIDTTTPTGKAFLLTSESGTLDFAGQPSREMQLYGQGMWTKSSIVVDTFSFDLAELQLALTGTIPLSDEARYEAHVRLAGDPSGPVAFLRNQLEMPELATVGQFDVSAVITGTQSSPQASVRAHFPSVTVGQGTIANGYADLRVDLDSLRVDTLRAEALGGTLSAEGGMAVDSVLNGRFQLVINSIDVPKVLEAAYDTAGA